MEWNKILYLNRSVEIYKFISFLGFISMHTDVYLS